ncbi:hypothetical protein SteCoe_34875 [Stentor coeruleus]|uniref:Uncharacterized protein n=1 Tax=Stentor coeruleus TaxID=5963 RepID=A0A1R2ATK6_9CILI|nr:hypothetical protein SteCoe_34875 [Stentor coeruleus]
MHSIYSFDQSPYVRYELKRAKNILAQKSKPKHIRIFKDQQCKNIHVQSLRSSSRKIKTEQRHNSMSSNRQIVDPLSFRNYPEKSSLYVSPSQNVKCVILHPKLSYSNSSTPKPVSPIKLPHIKSVANRNCSSPHGLMDFEEPMEIINISKYLDMKKSTLSEVLSEIPVITQDNKDQGNFLDVKKPNDTDIDDIIRNSRETQTEVCMNKIMFPRKMKSSSRFLLKCKNFSEIQGLGPISVTPEVPTNLYQQKLLKRVKSRQR